MIIHYGYKDGSGSYYVTIDADKCDACNACIEKCPQEHQLDQTKYLAELGILYGIDFGVGDLGYGQIQVKLIQDGGRDSKDNKFKGLGKSAL